MLDIDQVVRRCQKGHLDAFATLFEHFQNRVYDLACAIVRDEALAEDMVQETFMKIFQKIDGYKGEASFETWLTAIAVNQCRMALRKKKVRETLNLENLSPQRLLRLGKRDEEVDQIVYHRQQRDSLWTLVDQLDDRLRLPLIMRYRYDLPCSEIAVMLKKRTSTVYSHLHEGRRELERLVQRQEQMSQATLSENAG